MTSDCDIRFVYFDLGNILVAFDDKLACDNLAKLFGVSAQRARAALYDSGLEDRFEHGEFTSEEFAVAICRDVGVTGNPPAVDELLDAISAMFTPIDEMVGVMDQVRKSGRGIGILSNTCHAHWDWVLRQSYEVISPNLDATILSFEVGKMKPHSKIYEVAEQATEQSNGARPDQILFIDDRSENVAAAVARGWQAEQCFGGDGATGVLRKFGVLD